MMPPPAYHIFFSNTFPHLEHTNFVFPFFPLIPFIVPPTALPIGPPTANPNKPPVRDLPTENFFFVSAGIPTPSQPHLGHLIVF